MMQGMMKWVVISLVVAVIAALIGFAAGAGFFKFLFFLALAVFALTLIMALFREEIPRRQ